MIVAHKGNSCKVISHRFAIARNLISISWSQTSQGTYIYSINELVLQKANSKLIYSFIWVALMINLVDKNVILCPENDCGLTQLPTDGKL